MAGSGFAVGEWTNTLLRDPIWGTVQAGSYQELLSSRLVVVCSPKPASGVVQFSQNAASAATNTTPLASPAAICQVPTSISWSARKLSSNTVVFPLLIWTRLNTAVCPTLAPAFG